MALRILARGGIANISFWINGGTGGGQRLRLYAEYGITGRPPFQLPMLPANTWRLVQSFTLQLGVANVANLNRFDLQLTASGSAGILCGRCATDGRTGAVGPRDRGFDRGHPANGAQMAWSEYGGFGTADDTSTAVSFLREMGRLCAVPGRIADEYHWASNTSLTNTWHWSISFAILSTWPPTLGLGVHHS